MEERKGFLLFLDAIKEMDKKPIEVIFIGGAASSKNGKPPKSLWNSCRDLVCHINLQICRSEALNVLKELQGVIAIPSLTENSPCVIEELLTAGFR